jgi:hypothetical protein
MPGRVTTPPMMRVAMSTYLARFKGQSRLHTESDLRGFLCLVQQCDLDPLVAARPQRDLLALAAGGAPRQALDCVPADVGVIRFYRICVIDGVIESSPAEDVRRPTVPAESPTPGLSHLQFEAITAACVQQRL